MYVRKRDPRVKRYRETLEKRRQEQLQRVEQIRRQQLKENLEYAFTGCSKKNRYQKLKN